MKLTLLVFKLCRKFKNKLANASNYLQTFILLKGNGVTYDSFLTIGKPFISVATTGYFKIGKQFIMINTIQGNPIGCYSKCTFFVHNDARLTIGNNVGISQTAMICYNSISIGDNVKIGGGVKLYDTDFHSLDPKVRNSGQDSKNSKSAPIIIKNSAFIGAYSIILKGVTIGENAIVGAGSVVSKSIPDNEIWGGNPAKFIKTINRHTA